MDDVTHSSIEPDEVDDRRKRTVGAYHAIKHGKTAGASGLTATLPNALSEIFRKPERNWSFAVQSQIVSICSSRVVSGVDPVRSSGARRTGPA